MEIENSPSNELVLSWWQQEMLEDIESDIICVTAGYGAGKTLGEALAILDRLSYNPGCDALFIEPQYSLIKRVAIPAFETAFDLLGWRPRQHYKIFTSTENPRIELYSRQKIYFLTGESPETIVGITTAAVAAIDEIGIMEKGEEVLQKTRARLRFHKAVKPQLFLGTTPEGIGWFSDMFDSDTQHDWVEGVYHRDHHKIATNILPNGQEVNQRYRRLRATTFDNEHNLSPSYIPNLLETWKGNQNYIDSYVYGYFRPFATGLAYSNFRSDRHLIQPIPPNPRKPIHLTWDFNICPTWVSIQRQHQRNLAGQHRDYWATLHNSNQGHEILEDAVVEFASKHPRKLFGHTPIVLYGDSNGYNRHHRVNINDYMHIQTTLHRLGYKYVDIAAIKANPLERTSVDLVQTALMDEQLRICNNCDMVQKSATRTRWAEGGRAKLHKPSDDTWTHWMDAVKYFFCAVTDNKRKRVVGMRH